MSGKTIGTIIGGLFLFALGAVVGIFGYIYVVGGSGEASAPISAPTVAVEVSTGAAYNIVPAQSEARFILTEDLRGQPTTVTGVTKEVAGQILVDTTDPTKSTVGVIRVNARTLATDNDFRNRAIRSEILESAKDEYEFIEFTPNGTVGLPTSITAGSTITFQVTGDLKIRDISQPVTFDVTVTMDSDSQLTGSASTKVSRTQFNLVIPNAPGVANVSEEVTLELDFVATKAA